MFFTNKDILKKQDEVYFISKGVRPHESKAGDQYYVVSAEIIEQNNLKTVAETELWLTCFEYYTYTSEILKLYGRTNSKGENLVFKAFLGSRGAVQGIKAIAHIDCLNFLKGVKVDKWSSYCHFLFNTSGKTSDIERQKLTFLQFLYMLDLIDDLKIHSINDMKNIETSLIQKRLDDICMYRTKKLKSGFFKDAYKDRASSLSYDFICNHSDFNLGLVKDFSSEEIAYIEEWEHQKYLKEVESMWFPIPLDEALKIMKIY